MTFAGRPVDQALRGSVSLIWRLLLLRGAQVLETVIMPEVLHEDVQLFEERVQQSVPGGRLHAHGK